MVVEVTSGMVQGIQGELITVQTDISEGLPVFCMIGHLSAEAKEARERVRTAMKNIGFRLPPKRVSVNLAPADMRKVGTYYDLSIAVGLCIAMKRIPENAARGIVFLGELALDGSLSPLTGVLPILKKAAEAGYEKCIIPVENMEEAAILPEITAFGFRHLKEVLVYLTKGEGVSSYKKGTYQNRKNVEKCRRERNKYPDLSEVKGQKMAKRALEIAVAGYHNLFLDGPPGAGKSMLASCVPGIMPEMTQEEKIDTTMIYSVKGLFEEGFSFMTERPFRAPSSSTTMTGMFGGGNDLKPGEISLAHHGVLFLDEFPEFKREVIELFRVPLEEHHIIQIRNGKTVIFPADFILIAAANPCPCGFYPDRSYCRCSQQQILKYQNKLSGPILDRLDLFVRCDKISYSMLINSEKEDTSMQVKQRICHVWEVQRERFQGSSVRFNGRMRQKEMKQYCKIDEKSKKMMESVFETFHLTGRAYFRILKVARTIADLEGKTEISQEHLQEALLYRRTSPILENYE